jgi:hypothetical protein
VAAAEPAVARVVGAVAHDQPVSALVTLADELGDVGIDLGPQRLGQHPAGALADELVDQHHPIGTAASAAPGTTVSTGRIPDRRWRADLA